MPSFFAQREVFAQREGCWRVLKKLTDAMAFFDPYSGFDVQLGIAPI
jgi:hypothetical protein